MFQNQSHQIIRSIRFSSKIFRCISEVMHFPGILHLNFLKLLAIGKNGSCNFLSKTVSFRNASWHVFNVAWLQGSSPYSTKQAKTPEFFAGIIGG